MRLGLFIAILISPLRAFASPITFGPEFELTNQKLIEHGSTVAELKDEVSRLKSPEYKAAQDLLAKVKAKCPECTIVEYPGKYGPEPRVFFDDFYFQISIDPKCVEIIAKPSTLNELRSKSIQINDLIFNAGKDALLKTDYATGAGHINFGSRSAFDHDPKAFFQYFNDFANHPALAEGAWGEDLLNAPGMHTLTKAQQESYRQLLARSKNIYTLQNASREIAQSVYMTAEATAEHNPVHYQAFGLKRVALAGTSDAESFAHQYSLDDPFEIRSVYPQKSIEEFILECEIIEARIDFLKKENPPLVYINWAEKNLSKQFVVDSYYKYLTEMKLDWDRYQFTMHPNLRKIAPGNFVRGKVTWNEAYARSVENFFPYLESSSWVRERMIQAFTHPNFFKNNKLSSQVLKKLLDHLKENSSIHDSIQVQKTEEMLKTIFDDPTWVNTMLAEDFRSRHLLEKSPNSRCLPMSEFLRKTIPNLK